MSYSVGVKAATKEEAKKLIAEKLTEVITHQPVHQADIEQAKAAANSFIDVLPNNDTKDISISVHGSVSWNGLDAASITTVSVGINAGLVDRATE